MLVVLTQRSLEVLAFHFLGDLLVLLVQLLVGLHFQLVTGSMCQHLHSCPLVPLHQCRLSLIGMEVLTGTITHHPLQHMMQQRSLLMVSRSVPRNTFSTLQGQWQHLTVQVITKWLMVVGGHSLLQAAMEVTLVQQDLPLPAAMQVI